MAAPRPRRLGALSPSYQLRRRAMSKGVFGGERSWQVVAALMYGSKFLRKSFGRQPEVLISEVLKPGEAMTISTARPASPKKRRRT